MLSQVARVEFGRAGVKVSVVYPALTVTEFHQHLRAPRLTGGAARLAGDPPERVAETIAFAILTGEAHVLVADPPRPISPGEKERA